MVEVMNTKRIVAVAVLGTVLAGCATWQQIAALRLVDFDLDHIADVRLVGMRLDGRRSTSDFTSSEIARLAEAMLAGEVPLDLTVHVRAENPKDNKVTARLVDMDWTLFVEDQKTVGGKLAGTYLLPPGEAVDVPVSVHLDLVEFFQGGGRELLDLALALAGGGSGAKDIRLEAVPTVQTGIGPIRYPGPIVIRRTVGG